MAVGDQVKISNKWYRELSPEQIVKQAAHNKKQSDTIGKRIAALQHQKDELDVQQEALDTLATQAAAEIKK